MFKQLSLKELKPGMVLTQPLVSRQGSLVVEAGTLLTEFILGSLQNPVYMNSILPEDIGFDNMKLNVFVVEQHGSLSVEDLSHVGVEVSGDEGKLPNPNKEHLLDPYYVALYDNVMEMLCNLLDPRNVSRGLDLDAIGQLIADRQLEQLCDGARAVTQIHNMNRDGSYLLHHSLHVAILAGLMGRWLHWPREHRERLVLAGLLHDVGKLKISDDILNKPGKLTPSEMEIVRRHSSYSAEILAKCGLSGEMDIMAGVLQHHERGDGSGYPSGIKKEIISPFGKILAILDIYDAMAANRAYAHKVSPFEIFDRLNADMMEDRIDAEYGVLFVKKVCHALTGSWLRLTSGEKAKIIYIDQSRTNALPIVETTEGKFYDLAHDGRVKIVELMTLAEAMVP
ncbi:MAG: HD domain-containing protein [Schwartzia succinivorans]|nr:HD domain-containing protein [Schwartzia succinivorans]